MVVAIHAGAEGTAAQHLTGQDEIYGGENRGNPEAFARMAIDAGADLVIGSGPHVLRGMEMYRRRLIAYSLGNFAGYHNFGLDGALADSGVLHVGWPPTAPSVRADQLDAAGRRRQPVPDPAGTGAALIEELSRDDLGAREPGDPHRPDRAALTAAAGVPL